MLALLLSACGSPTSPAADDDSGAGDGSTEPATAGDEAPADDSSGGEPAPTVTLEEDFLRSGP